MERKLVTVRVIDSIEPHDNADRLEIANIGGWQCVVGKGEFKTGDYGVYHEIDSIVPVETDERYAFLNNGSEKIREVFVDDKTYRGVKLKTRKFRGQLSQGLLLPLEKFPEIEACFNNPYFLETDYAPGLNITKWEPILPDFLTGKVEGRIPDYIKKTDEERCQNLDRSIFDHHYDDKYEVSIKLDGQSLTIFYFNGHVGVCSRRYEQKMDDEGSAFVQMAKATKLPEAMPVFKQNIAIQGELIGPKIQGNNERLQQLEYRIFNIWDIDRSQYFGTYDRQFILSALESYGAELKQVPMIYNSVTLAELGIKNIKDLLKFAEGPSMNPDRRREGVVFKNSTGDFSFKAISNKYLLENED